MIIRGSAAWHSKAQTTVYHNAAAERAQGAVWPRPTQNALSSQSSVPTPQLSPFASAAMPVHSSSDDDSPSMIFTRSVRRTVRAKRLVADSPEPDSICAVPSVCVSTKGAGPNVSTRAVTSIPGFTGVIRTMPDVASPNPDAADASDWHSCSSSSPASKARSPKTLSPSFAFTENSLQNSSVPVALAGTAVSSQWSKQHAKTRPRQSAQVHSQQGSRYSDENRPPPDNSCSFSPYRQPASSLSCTQPAHLWAQHYTPSSCVQRPSHPNASVGRPSPKSPVSLPRPDHACTSPQTSLTAVRNVGVTLNGPFIWPTSPRAQHKQHTSPFKAPGSRWQSWQALRPAAMQQGRQPTHHSSAGGSQLSVSAISVSPSSSCQLESCGKTITNNTRCQDRFASDAVVFGGRRSPCTVQPQLQQKMASPASPQSPGACTSTSPSWLDGSQTRLSNIQKSSGSLRQSTSTPDSQHCASNHLSASQPLVVSPYNAPCTSKHSCKEPGKPDAQLYIGSYAFHSPPIATPDSSLATPGVSSVHAPLPRGEDHAHGPQPALQEVPEVQSITHEYQSSTQPIPITPMSTHQAPSQQSRVPDSQAAVVQTPVSCFRPALLDPYTPWLRTSTKQPRLTGSPGSSSSPIVLSSCSDSSTPDNAQSLGGSANKDCIGSRMVAPKMQTCAASLDPAGSDYCVDLTCLSTDSDTDEDRDGQSFDVRDTMAGHSISNRHTALAMGTKPKQDAVPDDCCTSLDLAFAAAAGASDPGLGCGLDAADHTTNTGRKRNMPVGKTVASAFHSVQPGCCEAPDPLAARHSHPVQPKQSVYLDESASAAPGKARGTGNTDQAKRTQAKSAAKLLMSGKAAHRMFTKQREGIAVQLYREWNEQVSGAGADADKSCTISHCIACIV